MKKIFLITAAILSTSVAFGQDAPIIKLPELQQMMVDNSEAIHIINFWATWCGPCVKELPLFEKINAEGRPDVKVTLVSMDLDLDPDPGKVYKFLERKSLKSKVVLLDERDPDTFIDKIEPRWSGALPATVILNHKTGKRIFIERSLREGELEKLLLDLQQTQ